MQLQNKVYSRSIMAFSFSEPTPRSFTNGGETDQIDIKHLLFCKSNLFFDFPVEQSQNDLK